MMQHRHLVTNEWTLDAIDSVLDRGDLPDWRELFSLARTNLEFASRIFRVVTRREDGGAAILARELCQRYWPEHELRDDPPSA